MIFFNSFCGKFFLCGLTCSKLFGETKIFSVIFLPSLSGSKNNFANKRGGEGGEKERRGKNDPRSLRKHMSSKLRGDSGKLRAISTLAS